MKALFTRSALALAALLFVGQWAIAQTPTYPTSTANTDNSAVPADNTGSNKDASNRTGTADDQKENATDLALTQNIRKGVMADKSLSTYAHNVKIVAVNGTVTLNGVVRSDEEKNAVQQIAVQAAGNDHVINDLKVAPAK
jgi:hyperosmotically inducible periplasmic protein